MKNCDKDNNQLEGLCTKVIFGMPKTAKFNVISWIHDKYMKLVHKDVNKIIMIIKIKKIYAEH